MMIVETPQTETTIVDVVEEPIPGVFVVTEIVETNAEPEPTDSLNIDQTIGPEFGRAIAVNGARYCLVRQTLARR